jgi:SPX domain protein involved in polyphosphate accumulation
VQEKIQGIANDSLELHNSVMKTKEHLQSIASCAESVFNTDLKEVFEEKMSCTPWNGPDSTLAVVLSDLFQAVRDLENGADGGGKWEAPSSFTRETIKHFVEPNKLSELLYTCCQEVPLLVYGKEGCLTSDLELDALEKDKLWASLATKISSIYFDSLDGTLYHDRIRRSEGAQLFRVRWYGEKPSGDEKLFLELKTHHEPWTQASSVKERVNLCEKHMSLFLDHKPWTYVEALPIVIEANPKLNGSDLDQAVDLLLQMHQLVIDKNLRPRVRSVYQRVAFQSSTSNALRLTVDRDVKMIDETAAPLGAWCLPDSVPTDEKLVPYPIFEVKLAGSDMPASIDALNENGTLIQAAKFSKFLTGA